MPWFHVYALQSLKDRKFYIGLSQNVVNRLRWHNAGQTVSTAQRRPFASIFFESFLNKQDAERRGRYFKTTKGKTTLKQMLRNYLKADTNQVVPG
ncbi:MAG: GIY-YIG nuclease family protein [Candidatus Kerfeldbacteria bacterium]|nr:GIY-YIG nuclease family protein [Candidatus Kerfeldbacteria bacterium]